LYESANNHPLQIEGGGCGSKDSKERLQAARTQYHKFTHVSDKFNNNRHQDRRNTTEKAFSPEISQTEQQLRRSQNDASFRSSRLSELNGLTLNKVRKNRKEVESDVVKLHNRIKMLQIEEEKALKKINETRQKAK
jgi:uncharacterized protein YcbK (DUF882 family)